MEARLRNGTPSSGNDDKLRLLTQQLDTLNQTVKQLQAKLKEAQVELASKTKAIESSHLLNKKLDKEVQQLKEEVSSFESKKFLNSVIQKFAESFHIIHSCLLLANSWMWREARDPVAIETKSDESERNTRRKLRELFKMQSRGSRKRSKRIVAECKPSKCN